MYKVILEKELIEKYFECYQIGIDESSISIFYLKSINSEIDNYIINIIYYNNSENNSITKTFLKSNDSNGKFVSKEKIFREKIFRGETVCFSFDTEEEAFYFKLKFC